MLPLLSLLAPLVGRLIDTKNPKSQTNISTAVGVVSAPAAILILTQSEDPVMQAVGALGILASAFATLYKEKGSDG